MLMLKVKKTIQLSLLGITLFACVDSHSSDLFFGWDDNNGPEFGWDTDLTSDVDEVMANSTSSVLTKFVRDRDCNKTTPCLKYVLRLPVEGESNLGVETLTLASLDRTRIDRLHKQCEKIVKTFIARNKSAANVFKKFRSFAARNVDKASCDIEIYNKKIQHQPKTTLKESDIGIAFTLNTFTIKKFKKGLDTSKIDITQTYMTTQSDISELYLGKNARWSKLPLKNDMERSKLLTSSTKNLDPSLVDLKIDKDLQKKAVEKMGTVIKEGNLSSTIKSYKDSALGLLKQLTEINDLDSMSSMLRLGYTAYENICKDNCRIVDEQEDLSKVFKSSAKEDEKIFFDGFSLIVETTIDGFFTESDAETLKATLGI